MTREFWRHWSLPPRLTAVSATLTVILALLVAWALEARLHGLGAFGWAVVLSGLALLWASLLVLARYAREQQAARNEQLLSDTVECVASALSEAIELRDKEAAGHTQRVTSLTLQLAEHMGLGTQQLRSLRHGCLLHDIGKLAIPEAILLKPGPLTDDERRLMKQHPELAHRIFSRATDLAAALDIPYCHHEHWDGSGYPRGLRGEEIPVAARLFAVVDVFDALTSDRPYREAWTAEYALEYIRGKAGKHFDPQVVRLFLEAMSTTPTA